MYNEGYAVMSILFKNAIVLYGKDYTVIENCNLVIKDKIIDYIGKSQPQGHFDRVIDATGLVIMAGLVNCHTHIAMSSMRGLGENLPLDKWLNDVIFPYEDKLNGETVYYNCLLSILEALSFGTTAITDMYFFMDDIAKAVLKGGIKANLSRSIVSFDNTPIVENSRYTEGKQAYLNWHGKGDGRIKVDYSLHAEYTNTDMTIGEFADIVEKENKSVHLHISETAKEVNECRQRNKNLTPVMYFLSKGMFKTNTIIAHGTHITKQEAEQLKDKNVTVVHCPVSNLKLASGIADIPMLMSNGINIALGTDGQASNNNLDMLSELKLASILHKGASGDATIISPKQALDMATINGAKAQGREDTGVVLEGKKADLLVLTTNNANMQPVNDIINHIVYSATARDVVYTIVDGEILYDNGSFPHIDHLEVKNKVAECNKKILESLSK